MKRLFMLFMGLMVLSACASQTGPKYEGVFVPKDYEQKFVRGVDEHTLRWVRPGLDAKKYNKAMVDYVVFALASDSEYKGINADEMKKLADAASLALVNAIKEKHEIVSEPGPDVIRVRFAITDLKQSRPVLSAVTTVVPVGLAISLVKKGVSDDWTGGGMTKAEVMFLDSMTGEILGAAYGDYSATFGERYTKWGEVEDAFKKWGMQIDNAWASLQAGTFMTPKGK